MITSPHSIPNLLQDLLKKLEFIAMIQKNQKPNINTMEIVDSKSWYGAWTRFWLGESKQNLMLNLDQIIQQTIQAINEYHNTEYVVIIVNALANSKVGFINLLSTYQHRPHVIAQLKVFLTNIDMQLEKNRYILQSGSIKPTLTSTTPLVAPAAKGMILTTPTSSSSSFSSTEKTNKDK